jgi:hypothetical protein
MRHTALVLSIWIRVRATSKRIAYRVLQSRNDFRESEYYGLKLLTRIGAQRREITQAALVPSAGGEVALPVANSG